MPHFLLALALTLSLSAQALFAEVLPSYVTEEFGTPPAVPEGDLAAPTRAALDQLLAHSANQTAWRPDDIAAFNALAETDDPRVVWAVLDMLRFAWRPEFYVTASQAAQSVLGVSVEGPEQRARLVDHMLAWEIPAYPGYLADKRQVFTRYLGGLEEIFVPGDIAWHHVDWGGVKIDARPYNATLEPCHCIPASDNPEVSSADEATWLKDEDIVFGVVINGEARAYPRRIMEIREMVNDTLGGRDIGMPYCTLCGAAQAYFTDQLAPGIQRPILRTSGLLIRSNKVMYDVVTKSVFDTFKGTAVTGPLAEAGLQLEQATVITSTWGEWRAAYPETTVLVEALALGRDFDLRNTRDANGPIFPVGDVDPRLSVHDDVIAAITGSGTPIAFPRARAMAALLAGQEVRFEDVTLELAAGGARAVGPEGQDIGSHQAFWFAWSQFYPTTKVWEP